MNAVNQAQRLVLAVASVMMVIFSVGCASTTTIDSDPQGAEVTVNGQHIGTTPVQYSDSATIMARHSVVLEKPGYEPLNATLRRDGDVNVGAAVVGALGIVSCVLFPLAASFLWVMDYPDQYDFELQSGQAEEQRPDVVIDNENNVITFYLTPQQDNELAVNSCGSW